MDDDSQRKFHEHHGSCFFMATMASSEPLSMGSGRRKQSGRCHFYKSWALTHSAQKHAIEDIEPQETGCRQLPSNGEQTICLEVIATKLASRLHQSASDLIKHIEAVSSDELPCPQLQVVLYFDEAHTLVDVSRTTIPTNDSKLPLDHLMSALNAIVDLPFFAIFLSTQSNIEHLAPTSYLARSARYKSLVPHLHSPITETPFDVWSDPSSPKHVVINPSRMRVSQVEDIVYLSLFGRPL
jgi:hypothetical protein